MAKAKTIEMDDLVEGLKAHDAAAIDDLVNQYSRPLFGVILNYTKNPSDAEEIVQDTLLKIVRKIDTFRAESDIWPWMKRIAINNAIMWLRKHKTKHEVETQLEDGYPTFTKEGSIQYPVFGWSVDPEEVVLNSELSAQLYEAIQSLPYEYRVPLVLRDIEGYSIKQIASLLALKEATTKTRIHRARLFVRDKLGNYLDGSP